MKTKQTFDEGEFAHTIVRILIEGGWFELVPIDAPVEPTVQGSQPLPISGILHVISGCNPGYRESDEINEQRHVQMAERLRSVGAEPMPAVGMSSDGTWIEPSWAVAGLARETVCAFGREFGQVAVFEVEAGLIRVVHCPDGTVMSTRPFRVNTDGSMFRPPL